VISTTAHGAARAARIDSSNDVVVANDVSVRLRDAMVWSAASFGIPAGSFTAVVGPNGAGKTTLLKLLLGLVPASSGTLRVLGRPPRRGDPEIGYVPQRRSLDAETPIRGVDIVRLGMDGAHWGIRNPFANRSEQQARLDEVIAAVGATAFAHRSVGLLSGGEQQRLMLAQALCGDPKLLLLDEPLASLDMRNQVAIAHLVKRIVRENGVTAMMVTHDMNPILGVIDHVVYIAQGRVLSGSPQDVVTTATLSAMYGGQVEVLRDSHGHVFVVGLDQEAAHPHE
jgi:zinc/manganese transport system ATP-binding protein